MTAHRSAGFTLMETLVSLIVLGFIIGGLVQGLRFGVSVWDRQVRTIDRDSALDSTERVLRMLLSRMAPGDDPQVPAIDGDAERLSFTADLPVNAPASPMRLADVTLDESADGRLVLRWTTHLHARRLVPPLVQRSVLLSGVRQLRFAYFRPQTAHDAAGWVKSWQSANPPELVRMHIEFLDRSRHWPDVIVAPMCEANND